MPPPRGEQFSRRRTTASGYWVTMGVIVLVCPLPGGFYDHFSDPCCSTFTTGRVPQALIYPIVARSACHRDGDSAYFAGRFNLRLSINRLGAASRPDDD